MQLQHEYFHKDLARIDNSLLIGWLDKVDASLRTWKQIIL